MNQLYVRGGRTPRIKFAKILQPLITHQLQGNVGLTSPKTPQTTFSNTYMCVSTLSLRSCKAPGKSSPPLPRFRSFLLVLNRLAEIL